MKYNEMPKTNDNKYVNKILKAEAFLKPDGEAPNKIKVESVFLLLFSNR